METEQIMEKPAEAEIELDWRKIAFQLYQIIDNIDTISDMAKENDKEYRRAVTNEQEKRHEVIQGAPVDRLYDDFCE